jgi:hypothetical protein
MAKFTMSGRRSLLKAILAAAGALAVPRQEAGAKEEGNMRDETSKEVEMSDSPFRSMSHLDCCIAGVF